MPLDALCLSAVLGELEGELVGSRVDKVYQPARDEIILSVRKERSRRLLISAGTSDMRIHFTQADFENPASPPMFCMLLRKHLIGARIVSIEQPPGERVVILTLYATDQLGDKAERRLIAELMGRNSNIILLDHEGIVIDCLRRVDMEMSEKRPVLPGLRYMLPPAQNKLDPTTLNHKEWESAVASAPLDIPAEKWLGAAFLSLPPLIGREIAYRAGEDTSATISELRIAGREAALARCAFELINVAKTAAEPWLLSEPGGKMRDFSYTQITQYGEKLISSKMSGFSELLDTFYTARATDSRNLARASALLRTVKNARDRAERRVAAQREELLAAGNRDHFRECGDLITANLHTMKRGDKFLRAQDFYAEEENATREIALDVRKSPQQNAAKYYKDYTKAKTAEQILGGHITGGEQEIRYLESVLAQLELAPTEIELEDIKAELAGLKYVRGYNSKQKKKQKRLPPRRYVTQNGYEVLVGRNNTQNDELTFKTAFRTDIWLHIKDIHGSHCILRTGGAEPPDEDITQAAQLAAYFSQARGEKRALVDYCAVRHVKKQPNSRPGMVNYVSYKTVAVEPGDNLKFQKTTTAAD